jgi:hypothetical protein
MKEKDLIAGKKVRWFNVFIRVIGTTLFSIVCIICALLMIKNTNVS